MASSKIKAQRRLRAPGLFQGGPGAGKRPKNHNKGKKQQQRASPPKKGGATRGPTTPPRRSKRLLWYKVRGHITKLQRDNDLTANLTPFWALIRAITTDQMNELGVEGTIKLQTEAMIAIQLAAEQHLIELFMAANAVLNNRKGKTLVVQDLQLAYQLLHKRDYRNEQSVHWTKLEYSGPCLLDRHMTLNFYGPQTRRNRDPSSPAAAPLLSHVVGSNGSAQTRVAVPGHRQLDEFSIGPDEDEDEDFDPSSQAEECDDDGEEQPVTPSTLTRPSKASNSREY